MTYQAIQFTANNAEYLQKFLALPTQLYTSNEIMQNSVEEEQLISGAHVLSRYFRVYPILAIDENNDAVARCLLTAYPDRSSAYIGFFESINDNNASDCIMSAAEQLSAQLGYTSIIGPVDCSFWIRYRLKVNQFELPYSGEPYNKDYYEKFFLDSGYESIGEYVSNRFRRVEKNFHDAKFEQRLAEMKYNGYEIISPNAENFDKSLREIYNLLIKLYSDFQTFSRITEDEFCKIYSPLKKVIDYSMVKIAYYRGNPVGFFVTIPNFSNAVSSQITLKKLPKIIKNKLFCRDYVMLYMGVHPEHRGLGKALAETIRRELAENGAKSVGALIRKGKVNGGYFSELIDYQYEYRLYEKKI